MDDDGAMTSRPRGRPRTEPSEVQRRRILDAARRRFTEDGYDATTVAAIAREALVTRAVVYETVGDKETILAAVADELAMEVVEAFDRRMGSPDAIDRPLADFVHDDVVWFLELIASEPAITTIVRLSGRLGDPSGGPADLARRRIEDRLTQLHVERAAALGLDLGESARLLAAMVLSLVEGTSFRVASEPRWPLDVAAELVAEFVTAGYRRVVADRAATLAGFDEAAAVPPGAGTD